MTNPTFQSHLLATCSRETAEAAAKALFNALPSLQAVPESARFRFINSVLSCADSVRSAAAAAQGFYDVLDLYSTLADLDPDLATELEAASAVCVSVLDGSAALEGFEDVTDAPPPAPSAIVELDLDAVVERYFDQIAAGLGEGFTLFSKDGSYFVGNDGLSPMCIATAVEAAGFVRVFGSSLYYFNGLRFETIGVGTLAADMSAVSFSVCKVLASKLKHLATSNQDAWTKHVQETFTGSSAALDKKLAKIAELPCAVSLFFTKVAFLREVSSALLSNKKLYVQASELDGLATVDKLLARNGVVDLTSGTLSAPTSALPMSRVAGSVFDANAKAPRFNSFLSEIFPDAETITYVQTVLGAYLRGKASRLQGALILQGAQGAGGKTVFLNAIVSAFGSYGKLVPEQLASLFIIQPGATKRSDASGHDSAGASFAGVRLAFIDELAEGSSFNEVGFKSVTGRGDADESNFYEARAAYSAVSVKFPWLAGLTFATNSPIRAGHHAAIMRRMNSVECHAIAVPAEKLAERRAKAPAGTRIFLADPGLSKKLAAERDGILAWLVEGAKRDAALETDGKAIPTPAAVLAAGAATQRQEGTLEHFASLYLRPLAAGESPNNAIAASDFGGLLSAYFADLAVAAPAWIFSKDGRVQPGFYTKLGTSMGFQSGIQTTPIRGSAGSRIRRLVGTASSGQVEGLTYTDAAADLFGLPKVGSIEFIQANGLLSAFLADSRYSKA